jgi:hypothetical protein
MPNPALAENDSSFGSSPAIPAVTPHAPSTHRPRLSFGRLAVLFIMAATCCGLGFMLAPPQVILLEPGDDDFVVLNGCVVSACRYMASIRAQNRLRENFWSRVMLVRYRDNDAGHAYCVWQTDGQIFGYDRAGSFPIPGNSRDPRDIAESLARSVEKMTKKSMIVERAEFIEPKHAKLRAY